MMSILQKSQAIFCFLLVLSVSQNAVSQCGYDIELTSSNLTIQGSIFNTQSDGPDYPQELEWYIPTSGESFSSNNSFEISASTYGDCTICVDLKVTQQSGEECSEIICKSVNVSNPYVTCAANFNYQDYSGPMPVVGGIKFENLSTGPFTEWSWDFGDGNFNSQSMDEVTHFYQESGTYEVKLSVWNATPLDCYAEFSQFIDIYISDDPCDQLDCVWPGDTNGDGAANLEDLINIGVGFGMTGPPRETITSDWTSQPAEDWDTENADGVNYKHFDCNGDGTIGLNDIPAIQSNYVAMQNGVSITESNNVPISLSFDVDTVVITEENQYLEINAGINFGSSNIQMSEVYGVVLYLTYNKHYVVESAPVEFSYNESSFFGGMSEVLPLSRNIQEEGQTDIVLARNNGSNISGQGRVASIKFIIEDDIIDGRIENEGETFAVKINVVKAIDYEGNEFEVTLPEEPAGVFFQNGITTKTIELIDDDKIEVYPNPASDLLQVEIAEDLHPEAVEIFNLLGQRVIYNEMNFSKQTINVNRLPQGVYILKIKTEEGIGSKRIIIE